MSALSGGGPESQVVQPLRRDLDIFPGPFEDDGSPTAIIHDRLNETFDRLGWREREICARLYRPRRLDDLEHELRAETTIDAGQEELAHFVSQLHQRGFLTSGLFRDPATLAAEAERRRTSLASRAGRSLLFFRLPLLHPDRFLRHTLWIPALLGSAPFRALYWIAALVAVLLFAPRSGLYFGELAGLSWRGAVQLTLTVVFVKFLHEFSHAYAARVRGARVREMGLAFMILAPIPYTDVTDSWRLERWQRFRISAAGVRTELVVAAFAFIGWVVFPPGRGRDACLFLSSASLVSTLLSNLNPGMRFDGYYLLSDLLGVANLQTRGFTHARRFYRRVLLGLRVPGGEPTLGPAKRAALVAYAAYACLYRLGLYFGIALLVYRYFPKAIGIALFAFEILNLLVKPVLREIRETCRLARIWKPDFRAVVVCAAVAAALYWFFAPLPRSERLDAIAGAENEMQVFSPDSGLLLANNVIRGATVSRGQPLVSVANAQLEAELRRAVLDVEQSGILLDDARSGGSGRTRLRDRLAEAERAVAAVARADGTLAMNTVRAEADCVVLDADERLTPGVYVPVRRLIGSVVPVGAKRKITAYVREDYANDVKPGDAAEFTPDSDPGMKIPVRVISVQSDAAASIDDAALTRPFGGPMAVEPRRDGVLVPAEPVYRVTAELVNEEESADLRLGQTGTMIIRTAPRSYGRDGLLRLYRILLRESGF